MRSLEVIHLQRKNGEDVWMVVKRNEEPPYDFAEVASCPTRGLACQVVADAASVRAKLART